jgi:HEAT repeat protein
MNNVSFDDRLRAVVGRMTPDGRADTEALVAELVQAGATSDEALFRLARDRTVPSGLRVKACWLIARSGGEGAGNVLLELLADPDERVREDAAMALSLVTSDDDDDAISALVEAAQRDPAKSVRIAALFALGMMCVSAAAPAVLALVANPEEDAEIRADAAEATAHMRDDRVFDVLFAALDDPSPLVRYSAAYALGEQRDSRAVAKLTALAAQDHATTPWGMVASRAAEALEQISRRAD